MIFLTVADSLPEIPYTQTLYLDLLGECGAEHHRLADAFWRHCVLLYDASDLWLKAHV